MGRVAAVTPTTPGEGPDLAGRIVWPGMVDMHVHLDKGHIWPRAENPDGSFLRRPHCGGRGPRPQLDRARHRAPLRVRPTLRPCTRHGGDAPRISTASRRSIASPGRCSTRSARDGQGVSSCRAWPSSPLPELDNPGYVAELTALLTTYRGILGGLVLPMERLRERLATLLDIAAEQNFDLDLHLDETLDPEARSLPLLAELALERRFAGRIVVGHCCSLSVQPDHELARTLDLVARAGIGVVSLPMCNMFLQDRAPGRRRALRGVTVIQELAAAGVPVACASDNTRDRSTPMATTTCWKSTREAVRIAHLDRPFGDWARLVTHTPAGLMGITAGRIAPGVPRRPRRLHAREPTELLSRPQADPHRAARWTRDRHLAARLRRSGFEPVERDRVAAEDRVAFGRREIRRQPMCPVPPCRVLGMRRDHRPVAAENQPRGPNVRSACPRMA